MSTATLRRSGGPFCVQIVEAFGRARPESQRGRMVPTFKQLAMKYGLLTTAAGRGGERAQSPALSDTDPDNDALVRAIVRALREAGSIVAAAS